MPAHRSLRRRPGGCTHPRALPGRTCRWQIVRVVATGPVGPSRTTVALTIGAAGLLVTEPTRRAARAGVDSRASSTPAMTQGGRANQFDLLGVSTRRCLRRGMRQQAEDLPDGRFPDSAGLRAASRLPTALGGCSGVVDGPCGPSLGRNRLTASQWRDRVGFSPSFPSTTSGCRGENSTRPAGAAGAADCPKQDHGRRRHPRISRPPPSTPCTPGRRRGGTGHLPGLPRLPGRLHAQSGRAGLLAAPSTWPESHGFFSLVFYYFQIWELAAAVCAGAGRRYTVDVFITTFNEDVDLLRQTVRAAINMRYPHRTFVLDDGRRAEVKALCAGTRLRVPHARRQRARQGRQLEQRVPPDHRRPHRRPSTPTTCRAPTSSSARSASSTTQRVAIVQVPQRYHNLDSLQHRVSWRSRRMYGEQDVFFNLVMPGKDHWNASFFCGTGAVLRRSALAPHGGLAHRHHHRGHAYVAGAARRGLEVGLPQRAARHRPGADGLLAVYSSQRLRWAEGNLKIIRAVNPLTCRGPHAARSASATSRRCITGRSASPSSCSTWRRR